jgi:hypothetical protein
MKYAGRTVVAVALALSAESAAEAQGRIARPRHATVTAVGGVTQWDLSGTGSSLILGARLDRQLGVPWLLGEASLVTFRPQEQGGESTYLIPEAQVQLQVPRAIAPYLGAGIGTFTRVSGNRGRQSELTTSGAVGVRLWGLIPRAVVRGELRVRGIGERFTASAAEWTGGIGWSF